MPIIHRDTDYGVRALARLARSGELMSVSDLAETEGVPEEFLRKIMQDLNRAGMVESERGPFGGYRVSRDPAEIALLDVVNAIQGPVVLNACFTDPDICGNVKVCALHRRLLSLQSELGAWLSGIVLSEVMESVPEKESISQ